MPTVYTWSCVCSCLSIKCAVSKQTVLERQDFAHHHELESSFIIIILIIYYYCYSFAGEQGKCGALVQGHQCQLWSQGCSLCRPGQACRQDQQGAEQLRHSCGRVLTIRLHGGCHPGGPSVFAPVCASVTMPDRCSTSQRWLCIRDCNKSCVCCLFGAEQQLFSISKCLIQLRNVIPTLDI